MKANIIAISESSIWRRKEEWGEQFKTAAEEEQEKANTPAAANAFRERVWGSEKRIGVSVDGTMVYIREEGVGASNSSPDSVAQVCAGAEMA